MAKWFAHDLGLTSVRGRSEIQSFWHILVSSLHIPSGLSNGGPRYCPWLWEVTQKCVKSCVLRADSCPPILAGPSPGHALIPLYKSLGLSVSFLFKGLKCLAYCLGHKCSMYGVCYLSDGDGEDNDDYYYWCTVFSGYEVWTIRFNMGMIHCGLTGGDSFSRNKGLVAVIYTCLSQFPKKNHQQQSFVTWGPLTLPHCFPKMLLMWCSQKPNEWQKQRLFCWFYR